ncbi:MAG: hypothetical protein KGL39_51390, partial [Patescibacteria group bacterium]|nr:hypothetical protein [Patescibacteria group bacterium]
MPKFKKCDKSVQDIGNALLCEFETHKPILDARVNIELLFAFADRDDNNQKRNSAITKGGYTALGYARIIPVKDRVAGRGDAEIVLDGDWWLEAKEEEQRALLDHELHHLSVKMEGGFVVRDEAGRPKLKMRQHDYDFGWFNVIAQRHGK